MTYLHLFIDDEPGEVTTVTIYDNGYVHFDPDMEYSIHDLKDVIAEAEFEIDNAQEDLIDSSDPEFDAWMDSLSELP